MKTLKIRHTFAFALLAALILTPLAVAQPPGPHGGPGFEGPGDGPGIGPGHHGRRGPDRLHDLGFLARFLELTDEQIEQARALFEGTRELTQPIREDLRATHQELRDLLGTEAPDATQVGTLVLDIHDLRGQLRETREALLEDFRALLTPEQIEKLETLKDAREARRPHRRDRGLGPDGPGPESL